ncbi:MAG: DNA repair protein RecO [Deltaproteobacteria bacterium]|nr:DNA repair protein RecO [Deltaproteobacteria bacterium]
MPRVKDSAFIINKSDFGESDLIITLFTAERGKISTIGKGAKRSRRRFPGSLELFSLVNFNGFIKHPLALTRIDECQLIEPFSAIQDDLRSYFCGCYFLEIANRCCAERQANPALFALLQEIFTFLATLPLNRNFNCRIRLFELQIITLLGFRPQLSACLDCGRELNMGRLFHFSPQTGGLVCNACQPRHPAAFIVSRGTINMLNEAHRLDNELRNKLNFTPQVERESARLCRALLRWHSGCNFNSLKIMERYAENNLPVAIPDPHPVTGNKAKLNYSINGVCT